MTPTTAPRGNGVITIDGPAGSGKSTVARLVAERLGLAMLDTGAMYRAVTWAVLDRGVDPADAEGAAAVAAEIDLAVDDRGVRVAGRDVTADIRGSLVSGQVSVVAAHPQVRAVLRTLQREWMADRRGGVVEGRDIGTVVFPDADLKVFLTASERERAARRSGERPDEAAEHIAREIARRDHLDSTRDDSPLREADDAVVIDTTDLSIDEVVELVAARYRSIEAGAPR